MKEETAAAAPPRRVLVVLHEADLGGATISVLRCLPDLRRRGWEFAFWVPRPSALHDHLRDLGLTVWGAERPIAYSLAGLRLPPGVRARILGAPGYVRAFARVLDGFSPALVHANSHVTLIDVCIARAKRVPSVFHVHEIFGEGPKWALGRRLAFAASSEVVAVSEACAARLAVGSHRARVVRNGVELPPARREHERERIVVGSVGALSRRKGTDVFVEAAKAARLREPRLSFELVGAASDPLDAAWASRVLVEAKLAGIHHDERADVAAKLAEWDIFALSSRRDPFPLSMLEAMAAGLPVVGTAVDGIVEQVAPGTGRLVPPEDPLALADAIVELARAPRAERAAIGAAARARAESEFTIAAQAAGLDAAYRAALGGP